MRSRQRDETPAEALDELRRRSARNLGLMSDRLHDRQRVLDPMRELAEQQLLALLQSAALRYVAAALEDQPAALELFQVEVRLDDQRPAVPGALAQLASPTA